MGEFLDFFFYTFMDFLNLTEMCRSSHWNIIRKSLENNLMHRHGRSDKCCWSEMDGTGSISYLKRLKNYLKPLIHAFCMEFMSTRKHSDNLPRLKVTHADNADGLIILITVRSLGSIAESESKISDELIGLNISAD